ncbi:MAG: shikimate dehydrogenase [Cyclobacteriaceae bacterium]|nr:shikimate dehydrogenase [Cyclobacteriaceae bacterium]
MAMYRSELIGVFGFPVDENPTVVMQEAAFKALHMNWRYLNFEINPGELKKAIEAAITFGMKGFNLTIPHKTDIIPFLDEMSPDARLIGAVNTVKVVEGKLYGENTDGKGFVRALGEEGISLKEKRIQLLGAGGAARAIAVEAALAGASHIHIVNRDGEKGQDLTNHISENTPATADFRGWYGPVEVRDEVDILVNATSIGLYPHVSEKPDLDYDGIKPGMVVCDVIPNPPDTMFLAEAKKRGATALDGLGMLVYQGAIGFEYWTGQQAPIEVMKAAMRGAF